ncbi:GPI mannosyltransferase 3 [Bacillus rossius redtenbacheri]|uniref:GPI mannosyltransferase 3 n=1 Tax=Bacillus rossius redtenbacheri TaxID=93214 RepID=UPI002FDEBEF0
MKPYKMVLLFLAYRLASVFLVRTAHVPDEYWQSLEVAHKKAFGYGHLTWEWTHGIRSYLQVSLITVLYKLLKYFNLDSVDAVVLAPRVFQALVTACGDYYFWQWCARATGTQGLWAAYSLTTSWYWFYCGSRTLSNTLETFFTVLGLRFYPWSASKPRPGFLPHVLFAGLACVVRPTALVYWAPLFLYHLHASQNTVQLCLLHYLPTGMVLATVSFLLDSYLYDRWVSTLWNFVRYNVASGVSSWYGTSPAYWYLAVGLPAVLFVQAVPLLCGVYSTVRRPQAHRTEAVLLAVVAWSLAVFSLLPHKEFRFLLPLLPMLTFVSSSFLSRWSRHAARWQLWAVTVALLVGFVVPTVVFGTLHQRGTLDVVASLSRTASKDPAHTKLLFLMPCHSTPLYSHLHVDVPAKFLTCDPDFSGQAGYLDEAERFFRAPDAWLKRQYPSNASLPTHIVSYDTLYPRVKDFLAQRGYAVAQTFANTFLPYDGVGESVFVYHRN